MQAAAVELAARASDGCVTLRSSAGSGGGALGSRAVGGRVTLGARGNDERFARGELGLERVEPHVARREQRAQRHEGGIVRLRCESGGGLSSLNFFRPALGVGRRDRSI